MQLRVYVIANKINDKRQRILSEKEEYFIMIEVSNYQQVTIRNVCT